MSLSFSTKTRKDIHSNVKVRISRSLRLDVRTRSTADLLKKICGTRGISAYVVLSPSFSFGLSALFIESISSVFRGSERPATKLMQGPEMLAFHQQSELKDYVLGV